MALDAAIYGPGETQLSSVRLGNVSRVAFLRSLATQILGQQSLVASKILYVGTHSGDSIAIEDFGPLSKELEMLAVSADAGMRAFAWEMSALVRAAAEVETPIVFT